MKNHGTALSEGQLAEFVGAGAKALTLIANQLGPDLTDNWARNNGAMQKAFLSALCPLAAPMPIARPDFTIWRTVKYSGKDAAGYRASFKAKGIEVGTYANQILDKVVFPAVGTEMDIVRTSGAQVYFTEAVRRGSIYERILGFGLVKLEPWAALEARDGYLDQPKGEWLRAGMEPILDADRHPRLFDLERYDDGELWLSSLGGGAAYRWSPGNEWLFGLPRK